MKQRRCILAVLAFLAFMAAAVHVQAGPPLYQHSFHLIPDTSIPRLRDAGVRCHTNHMLLFTDAASSFTAGGMTPQDLYQIYNLGSPHGAGIIAIVDAFDYPSALNDFNVFSRTFNLPVETSPNAANGANRTFQVLYASGARPTQNGGWNQEAALDIEWAHAMAPGAKIVLVETATDNYSDLFFGIAVANTIPGVKEVSMSWGGSEFRREGVLDPYFHHPSVVYFAASGDVGGQVVFPSVLTSVVSCGATTLNFDAHGNFTTETGWNGTGGGDSFFVPRPVVQNGVARTVGAARGMPDWAFDGDPDSGVSVYDSTFYEGVGGWLIFGGTSVAAPALAGVANSASVVRGYFEYSTYQELRLLYAGLGTGAFRDITEGTAGSFKCTPGWDFVTGVGSPLGLVGK